MSAIVANSRWWMSATLLAVSLLALAAVNVSAADKKEKKTKKPDNAKKQSVDELPWKSGDRVAEVKYARDGTKTVTTIPAPEQKWMMGVVGTEAPEGFYLLGITSVRHAGKVSTPAANVEANIDGNKVKVVLEEDDVITKVDGKTVKTRTDVILAIHRAENQRKLGLEWIDGNTGDTMTGVISCVRIRP